MDRFQETTLPMIGLHLQATREGECWTRAMLHTSNHNFKAIRIFVLPRIWQCPYSLPLKIFCGLMLFICATISQPQEVIQPHLEVQQRMVMILVTGMERQRIFQAKLILWTRLPIFDAM